MKVACSEFVGLYQRVLRSYDALSKKYGDPIHIRDESYTLEITRTTLNFKSNDGEVTVLITEDDMEVFFEDADTPVLRDLLALKEMLTALTEIKYKRYLVR